MATTDYQTQLETVQAAIAAIEGGEREVRRGDRVYTDADLATLYSRERWLRKMVERATNSGLRVRQVVPRG